MRVGVRVGLTLSLALAGSSPATARADTGAVTSRVLEQWRAAGGRASQLPTRFIFDDETLLVPIGAALEERAEGGCAHVAVIGARGLGFRARFADTSNDPLTPEPDGRATSHAGVLELRRCGDDRRSRHLLVTSESGRGAIEIIVAHAPSALPPVVSVVPERTGGVLPPAPEPGALPPLPPPEKRAELAEARARRDGARVDARGILRAGEDGLGSVDLSLAPGCHRVEVFAGEVNARRPGRRYRLDVDAELREPESDRVVARDRTEAPDARLEACLGEESPMNLVFAGAPPQAEVIVSTASWPLPEHLPKLWGAQAMSRMARVLFNRHVVPPASPPVLLAQGGSGTTPLPLSVEVGGCYLAVVGMTHGHVRSLQIRTKVGARESTDERGAVEEAALSAFCVSAQESARIEVHARGSGLGWGLALYRVKSGVWEAGR